MEILNTPSWDRSRNNFFNGILIRKQKERAVEGSFGLSCPEFQRSKSLAIVVVLVTTGRSPQLVNGYKWRQSDRSERWKSLPNMAKKLFYQLFRCGILTLNKREIHNVIIGYMGHHEKCPDCWKTLKLFITLTQPNLTILSRAMFSMPLPAVICQDHSKPYSKCSGLFRLFSSGLFSWRLCVDDAAKSLSLC